MDGPSHIPSPPQRPVVVNEVFRIKVGSFWLLALIAAAIGGYFLATDWAAKNGRDLHSFSDYTNAVEAALDDKSYMKKLGDRIQDFTESPSCDIPLQWSQTGNQGNCYLTLDQPVRLYPGNDLATFVTVSAGSVLKIGEPATDNNNYAYAQTFRMGAVAAAGATTPEACAADNWCSARIDRLNVAGHKPKVSEASAPSPAPVFQASYGCVQDANDNPDDHVIEIDERNKTVRESIKRSNRSCEFLVTDGTVGPVTSRDKCDLLPDVMLKAVFFQRVEFSDDTVFYALYDQVSIGPLTADQQAHSSRLNVKTGVLQLVNGNRLQCRLRSSK